MRPQSSEVAVITCSNCSETNPEGHRFCSNCGHGLALVCPNCSTENDAGNKFCFNCGSALGAAGEQAGASGIAGVPPQTAERRLVSVLFADLVGYTTFSEGRDAEDVRAMLTDYYDRCRVIIDRYGGQTDKFIGDAVMGVWGAIAAHEDDAERSTRAALEIVDMVAGLGADLGIDGLAARAGVLSGEASVGPGGNQQGLVVGDLVNTASRLQSIAPPGGVVVGTATKDLVGRTIEFVELGEQQVKGKEDPVGAWQALRVVASSSARHGGELGEGPFVGRADELRILKDQLHATTRENQARLVSIVGEGGIGKTRLSEELLRYIDGITEIVYYHRGRSPSYGDGVTFWALGEMVRQRAGILEAEDDAKSRLKLRTMVAEYAPDEDDQRWIEPRLAGLIGLAPMPPGDRSELFAALRTLFLRVADQGTTVMVFEDLHWADDGLLDFIEELVERTTRNPILVLTLARSDLLERRPQWGSGQLRTLSMHLGRLDNPTVELLVTGLVPGIDPEVARNIAERTAGVPLHAVEFVRMLVNTGRLQKREDGYAFVGDVAEVEIPDSVSAVISARLDRLDNDELSVIQDASVLGYSFSLADLSTMRSEPAEGLGSRLRDLTRREILEVDEDPRSPERGQYRFVQSLIREVAYGRLGRADRVSRHLRVAQQFEEAGDVELAGVVASHYADAAAADPGNSELEAKARDAIVGAARRALSLHSHTQAVALFDRAIRMTQDEGQVAHLQLEVAELYRLMGRDVDAETTCRLAIESFERLGDGRGRVTGVIRLGDTLAGAWRADEAVELLVPVYESTPRSDDPLWAELAKATSRALMLANESEESVRVADEAIPVMEELGLFEHVVETLINKASALGKTGRWIEGSVTLRGVAELARMHDLANSEVRAINNLQSIIVNDDQRDRTRYDDVLRLAERLGDLSWLSRAYFFTAQEASLRGEYDDSYELLDLLDSLGSDYGIEFAPLVRLSIDCLVARAAEAPVEELMAEVERLMTTTDPQLIVAMHQFRGEALLFAGRYDEIVPAVIDVDASGESYPYNLEMAAMVSGLLRDGESLRLVAERVTAQFPHGRVCQGLSLFIEAMRQGIAGDVHGASTVYGEALDLWEIVATPRSVALMQVAVAKAIGPDSEAGQHAAAAAKAYFAETGSLLFLDLFADVLPEDEAGAESIAG